MYLVWGFSAYFLVDVQFFLSIRMMPFGAYRERAI